MWLCLEGRKKKRVPLPTFPGYFWLHPSCPMQCCFSCPQDSLSCVSEKSCPLLVRENFPSIQMDGIHLTSTLQQLFSLFLPILYFNRICAVCTPLSLEGGAAFIISEYAFLCTCGVQDKHLSGIFKGLVSGARGGLSQMSV